MEAPDISCILDNLADASTAPPFEHHHGPIKQEPIMSPTPHKLSHPGQSGVKLEMSQMTPKKKSKKGPAPKLFGNEKCKICESRATGFHYNVLSCEACKNFFRRAVVHNLKYECKIGTGGCSVQAGHRPRCQFCRMQMCRKMGMKNEYINRVGRSRKSIVLTKPTKGPVLEISEPYRSIIEGILLGWEGMEQIKESVNSVDVHVNVEPTRAFDFMSQMAAIKVKKIIYFCKHIPMWRDINEKLQICLIKGGLTEAMILYNTTDYDHGNKMVKFIDGKARSKEAFYVSGFHPDIVDAIFGIWEYCHKNKVCDVTSVALLTAAALTSPDRNFVRHRSTEKDRAQMDYVHTNIVTALQNHLLKTVSSSVMAFAKAVSVLISLRDISDGLMPRQLNQFSMLGLNMTPLFAEIYS